MEGEMEDQMLQEQTEAFYAAAKDLQEMLKYTKEMRDLLKNYDFEKRVKITQRISAIYEKMSNSEEYMKQKEKDINSERLKVENEIAEICRDIVGPNTPPTTESAQAAVEDLQKSLKEEKQKLKNAVQKNNDIESTKYTMKLQNKSLPVLFNESSIPENVQGIVRRDDGVIETFSFDVGKCGHVGVANLLWGTSPTTDEKPRVEELQLTEN